jgi:signal transduction histidine kinase
MEELNVPSSSGDHERLAQTWIKLLFDVSREFSSSLDLDEILGRVLSKTVEIVNASEGSVFLLDSKGKVIRSIIARKELPPEVKIPTIETVMREGFAGWVYENKAYVLVEDTQTDPRWHEFPGDRLNTRSAIGVPILRNEEVIGILTLTHPAPDYFSELYLTVLRPIADQAARAIENAALYTKIRSEKATLQAVIYAMHEPIWVFDRMDNLFLFNRSASHVLGFQPEDQGKPVREVISDPGLLAFCQREISEGQQFQEITLEDGRVFDGIIALVPDLGKVVSLHNITTLKQLDALKSEFVSHVSHDLKNPLSIISGYAGMLAEPPGAEETVDFANKILKAVKRMRGLIDNILDIGKIEMGIEGDFERVDLGEIIVEVVGNMEPSASQKKIKLVSQVEAGALEITGSKIWLTQAVTNLVGNALKFTPENGTVTVGAVMDGNALTVSVKDTGPGIPAALQEKLFQKFSKLGGKETLANEGHGLGLAIVKAVVDAHQGRVWVESKEGEGSAFLFALPRISKDNGSS